MINKYEDYKTPNNDDVDRLNSREEAPWDYEDYGMAEILNPGRDEAVKAVGESAVNMINVEFANEASISAVENPQGNYANEATSTGVNDADATDVGQFHLPNMDNFEQ